MGRGDGHQHDIVAHRQFADAMNDRDIADGPARSGVFDEPGDLTLGHARKMLQRQGFHAAIAAHHADKAGNRAHPRFSQRGNFHAGIEVFGLDFDFHPPVTGGKKATSSASATGASNGTCS